MWTQQSRSHQRSQKMPGTTIYETYSRCRIEADEEDWTTILDPTRQIRRDITSQVFRRSWRWPNVASQRKSWRTKTRSTPYAPLQDNLWRSHAQHKDTTSSTTPEEQWPDDRSPFFTTSMRPSPPRWTSSQGSIINPHRCRHYHHSTTSWTELLS